jgi:hypothetical protein
MFASKTQARPLHFGNLFRYAIPVDSEDYSRLMERLEPVMDKVNVTAYGAESNLKKPAANGLSRFFFEIRTKQETDRETDVFIRQVNQELNLSSREQTTDPNIQFL